MELQDKVAVVTGGASGIGRAMCRRFAAEGAVLVVVADANGDGADAVADEIGGMAVHVDVSVEADIQRLADAATARHGRIDLFCSNAGISIHGSEMTSDEGWQRIWDINVRAHIFAARAVLPVMIERGEGYLLNTASAAGLLTQIDSAPYAVTKHAAVAFAEWLSVTYGDAGIKVSCLCPQGVMTNMLSGGRDGISRFLVDGAISAEDCADAVVRGLGEEKFLILPHPQVGEYLRRKTSDYDRWLRGMRRLQRKVRGEGG